MTFPTHFPYHRHYHTHAHILLWSGNKARYRTPLCALNFQLRTRREPNNTAMEHAAATPTSSSTTTPTTPTQKFKLMYNKRPDSMKLELLTIPENGCVQEFPASPVVCSAGSIGFKDLSYSVREGLIRRRECVVLCLIGAGQVWLIGQTTVCVCGCLIQSKVEWLQLKR